MGSLSIYHCILFSITCEAHKAYKVRLTGLLGDSAPFSPTGCKNNPERKSRFDFISILERTPFAGFFLVFNCIAFSFKSGLPRRTQYASRSPSLNPGDFSYPVHERRTKKEKYQFKLRKGTRVGSLSIYHCILFFITCEAHKAYSVRLAGRVTRLSCPR